MSPSKFTPLVLGALLALAASGCAGHATSLSGRLEPVKHTRTPEELRIHKGPLSIAVDPTYGYGNLNVPQPKQQSFSLFIPSEAMPKLEKLDKNQPFEVRYWYHEQSFFDDVMIGGGELVSIRDASGTILDLSRCELHTVDMIRRPVPIIHGLPMREFLEARNRDFPHPASILGGCVVDEGSPKKIPHYVCPKCEAAAEAWSASFLANRK